MYSSIIEARKTVFGEFPVGNRDMIYVSSGGCALLQHLQEDDPAWSSRLVLAKDGQENPPVLHKTKEEALQTIRQGLPQEKVEESKLESFPEPATEFQILCKFLLVARAMEEEYRLFCVARGTGQQHKTFLLMLGRQEKELVGLADNLIRLKNTQSAAEQG